MKPDRAVYPRRARRLETRAAGVAFLLLAASTAGFAQGFSGKLGQKTTIVLERRLPAAVKLAGESFNVKATAVRPTDPYQKAAADKLQSTVETALVRYNTKLQLNPDKPDTLITIRVTDCNAIAKQENQHRTGPERIKGQQQPSGVKVSVWPSGGDRIRRARAAADISTQSRST